MKLRLPLTLQAILLAAMAGSVSYATTTPPADHVTQDGEDAPQVSVTWKPSPAAEEEAEAEEKAQNASTPLEELEQGEVVKHSAVTPQAIRDIMDARRKAVVGNSGFTGSVTSRRIGEGKTLFTFALGKGEGFTVTLDDTDTLAYWNRPEEYDPSYFPQRFFWNGYPAMRMYNSPSLRKLIAEKHEREEKEKRKNTTTGTGGDSGTGSGSGTKTSTYAPAPSFGGFGGYSAPRPVPRPAATSKPSPQPVSTQPQTGDDDEEDKKDNLADGTDTVDTPDLAGTGEESTASETALTLDAQEAPAPQPAALTTFSVAAPATAGIDTTSTGAPVRMMMKSAAPKPLTSTRPALTTLAVTAEEPVTSPAPAEEPDIAPVEETAVAAPLMVSAYSLRSTAPATLSLEPSPIISGAAASSVFTEPTPTTNATATWTGNGSATNINDKANWAITGAFPYWEDTEAGHNNDAIIKFTASADLSSAGDFNSELISNSANNGGIVVTGTGTNVKLLSKRWLNMIKVDAGASLELTMDMLGSSHASFQNKVAPGNTANVWVDGTLTIHNLGMCIGNGWNAHEQNWYIGANGKLTLADDIEWTGPAAPHLTWHIQKQENKTRTELLGTTVGIFTIAGSGNAYTKLLDLNDKHLLDIQIANSANQLMDGRAVITSNAVSFYIYNDLVWSGTQSSWSNGSNGFYQDGDDNREAATFTSGDSVHFATDGAAVTVDGTVQTSNLAVEDDTEFNGGTIQAEAVSVSAGKNMTLSGTTLATGNLSWGGNAKVSGDGTLDITMATATTDLHVGDETAFSDFTGTVELHQGRLAIGNTWNHGSAGTDATLGTGSTLKVYNGATFQLSLGGSDKTFGSNVWTENGVTFHIRDGHATWTGDVHINELGLAEGTAVPEDAVTTLNMYYAKIHTWEGVVSGAGTFKFYTKSGDGDNIHELVLANNDNTFSGTYELAGSARIALKLAQQNAAKDAKVLMSNSYTSNEAGHDVGLIISAAEATIAGLETTGQGKRAVYGEGAGSHVLTVNTADTTTFSGTFRNGGGTLSFTKSGEGVLTLSGDNTATGALTVAGGGLILDGDNSHWLSTTVQDGATLTLTTATTFGAITVQDGGLLSLDYGNAWFTGADASGSIALGANAKLRLSNVYSNGDTFELGGLIAANKLTGFNAGSLAGLAGRQYASFDEGSGTLTINGTTLTWGDGATGTWNTVENNTPWQNDQYFVTRDAVVFSTEGANATVEGAVTPSSVTISAETTFTGGSVETGKLNLSAGLTLSGTALTAKEMNTLADATLSGGSITADTLNLASTLTLSNASVNAGTVNVDNEGGISGSSITADTLNLASTLTLSNASVNAGTINVDNEGGISGGSITADTLNLASTLTLSDSVLSTGTISVRESGGISGGTFNATSLEIAAGKTATLSTDNASSISNGLTMGAGAELNIGKNVSVSTKANADFSMNGGTITLEGEGASFTYQRQNYTVSARTDLEEGQSSTITATGDPSLWSGATITNAVVTFKGNRHVRVALENCDVITDTNNNTDGDRLTRFYENPHNFHSLTVKGNTWIQSDMTIAGALVLDANRELSVKDGVSGKATKLTLNGTATINGGLGVMDGRTIAIGRTGSMVVNGTATILGTLEIDMTGRVGNASAIIDASSGTLNFTGTVNDTAYTGDISILNYDTLANGRYNLIQTNATTADTIVRMLESCFTNTADQTYEVSQTAGLVQLNIAAADVDPVTLTENAVWAHDLGYSVKKPVSVADGVQLTIVKGDSDFSANTQVSVGAISLGAGSTLSLVSSEGAEMDITARTVLTADKPEVLSPITMGAGSALQTEAGSWYFQGDITVEGDSTITNRGAGGVVYGAINSGEGAPHTLTFAPENNDAEDNAQVVSFAKAGTFSGTVQLQAATGASTGGVRYVIDSTDAFRNAEVSPTSGADLSFDVATANIRKLGGAGSLISNSSEYGGDYTGVSTLNVAESSTFSGTVGANISLVMGEDAALTLTNAHVAAGGSVTGSDLILAATEIDGTVNVTAGGTAGIINGSSLNGTLVLDLAGLTANGTPVAAFTGSTVGSGSAISLTNTADLALGTYNLISTDAATAKAMAAKVGAIADNGMLRYDALANAGMVQLKISYGATSNATWKHDTNIDTATPVTISNGSTVTIQKGVSDFGTDSTISLGDISVEEGSTLKVDTGMNTEICTILTTDKPVFASHITLADSATLRTRDGSWYFSGGLTVAGDATVINEWGRGLVYGAINGSGDTSTDATRTLTFAPDHPGTGRVQVISLVEAGDFGGKVVLTTATNGTTYNYGRSYYVIDNADAFKNAEVELAQNANLNFDVDTANIRKLSGSGILRNNGSQYGGNYTGVSTLNIAETSTFSGEIDTNVTIAMGTGADLTLNNSTINGRVGGGNIAINSSTVANTVTGTSITLDNSTINGRVDGGDIAIHSSSVANTVTGTSVTLDNSTVSGTVTGTDITLTGSLTLDMTGATAGTAKLTGTGFDTTGLTSTSLTNFRDLATGSYTIVQGLTEAQAGAMADQIGALSGSIFKSYKLTTDNGLGLDISSQNVLLTWTGGFQKNNVNNVQHNDLAYGIYKATTYDANGNAVVSNDHVLRSWNENNKGSGDLYNHKVNTEICFTPEVNDRANYSLRLQDIEGVSAADRVIQATFSQIVFGSIIVETDATDYKLEQSSNRDFYLGSSMDDPMHTIINEDFSLNFNNVYLRGKQNITVAQGKTFTLNKAELRGGVTLDGAGTLKDTGNFTLNSGATLNVEAGTLTIGAQAAVQGEMNVSGGTVNATDASKNFNIYGANAKLTVTGGTMDVAGNIAIYTNAGMEMTGGQVNTTRFFVHNADGDTKESAVISGGVLNATSDGKDGSNDSSAVMVGHYQQGTQANTLDIYGTGVLNAQNGAVVVSWNSPGALSIGGGTDKANGGELNADGLYFANGRSQKAEVYLTDGGRLNAGGTGIKAKKNTDVFQASGAATLGTLTETQWTMVPDLELAEGAILTVDTGVRETHADSASTAMLVDGEAVAGSINMTGALTGAGSLTKTGAGTLTLAGANTATGALSVSEGGLVLTGTNTAWSGVTIGTDGTLTISGNGAINLGTLTSTGHLAIGNTQELTHALGGTASVLAGGTLTLSGDGAVEITSEEAAGTLNITNNQTLTHTLEGAVNVRQNGAVTLATGAELTGKLTVDLTNATAGGDYMVTLATGSSQIRDFDLVFDKAATGVYNIVDTDSVSAEALKGMAPAVTISNHRIGNYITDEAGLQLDVHAVANPVAGQLYKWDGTESAFAAGSYVVAEYDAGSKTVYLSERDVLSDWNGDTSTSTGTQAGLHAYDIFTQSSGDVGSLLFTADFGGAKSVTFNFSTLYLGGIVVEGNATDYTISGTAGWTRQVHIGSLTEESHSYILEDFTISTGTTSTNENGASGTFFRGVQDIHIAQDKTFSITNAATNSGTLTLSGGGTMSIGGSVTNSGVIHLDNDDKFTAASMLVTGQGAQLNMEGGVFTLTPGTNSGLLNLHNKAVVNVSGGLMTVSRIILHDTANGSTTETMNISGGVVTVTSTNDTDSTSAALLIGHWQWGQNIALNVSGDGVLNVVPGCLLVGWDSAGTLNISGGEVNAHTLSLNSERDQGNQVNLSGGRLNIGQGGVINGGSNSSFTISGGTLGTIVNTEWNFSRSATLAVTEGNVFTIDTQVRTTHSDGASTQTDTAGNIKIGGVLSGSGDIEKTGKGTLTFAGDNTATGNLTVTAGEVVFQNSGGDNWSGVTVERGATLTYHTSSTKTDVNGVTNNGTLQIGNQTDIGAEESLAGSGVVIVQGNGTLTCHNVNGLADATRINVNANGTLALNNGFNQAAGQRIINNGSIRLGGTVALKSAEATLVSNEGVITLNEGVKFNMDDWEALLQPGTTMTKTFTVFTGLGTVNGADALTAGNFYLNGRNLTASDIIRSVSMSNQGVLTIQYWGTENALNHPGDEIPGELVLEHNNPLTLKVGADETLVVDSLTSTYTEKFGTITYVPGDYSFIKRGEGTLQLMAVNGNQIDNFTVTNGKVVLGAAPGEGQYDTVAVEAVSVHYDAFTGTPEAGTNYYVYDEAYGVYTPATDGQIAAGDGLYTRSYANVTVDKTTPKTDPETGETYGTKVVFDLGGSRITSMGGSLENISIDYATHRITSVASDAPAVLTDMELRLGNIINNDTSLVNVQFAGTSGLSGFVTIDQAGDNDMGANISVAADSTLTIGTATNNKLAFNFMPGTIRDHGRLGDADVWDHHLIDLGQDSNLVNWDNDHVAFYYNGVLTKGIISIGAQTDSNDHLGVAHIDTTKAPELLWNGTGNAWNPTNTLSTAWYEGENLGLVNDLYQHDWNNYEQLSRFYALSNVHFNTLGDGLNSDIRLGQDLTVLNFTIGVKVDDSKFGDTDRDGDKDGHDLSTDLTVGGDPHRTVYNKTAYTFSSGNLRILRDMYVRTANDLTFAGTFNIDAQNIYLYNGNSDARVTFGGKIVADNLTIGQSGVDTDCFGIYTFNGAVNIATDLYIHVDSKGAGAVAVDQALFNSTLNVGRDAMVSGFGSKGFKGTVTIGRDLTVTSCRFNDDPTQVVATSSQAAFSDILTVNRDLIIQNGGSVILFKRGSQVKGEVQMYNGTLTMVDGTCNTFTNGGRNWTFKLMGDDGHLNLSPNTFAHITKLYSGDGRKHDFTIEGNSRNTDIHSMADVKDFYINGGKITFRENTSGKTNTGGIHGDFYVGSTAAIFLNGNDIFSTDSSTHGADNGHTITVDGGVMTLLAGTHQSMTDKSKLVLNSATVIAPVTDRQVKGAFVAMGGMGVDFSGFSTLGADITVNAGADAEHINKLTFHDTMPGVTTNVLSIGGAISAAENAQIVLTAGTHVQLDGGEASMSGEVLIKSDHSDLLNFLNSALTVTQAKQTDHAKITVEDGASLNVIASTPVDVDTLNLLEGSTLSLAALTGTKDLDSSLSCLHVTGTADLTHPFNIYFQDKLKTMQTYAILNLTDADEDNVLGLTHAQLNAITIYTHDSETGTNPVLESDQYELKVSSDGKTLYLATFFGRIWDGGVKAGDTDADGWWTPENVDKNWTDKDWTEGQTAIFRDLGPEEARTASSTVHVQGTIHVDGIYVTAEETDYTFIGEETTLRNVAGDDPDITKNGAAVFTMQDFGNEQLGKIDINRGVMQIKGSTIDFTEELVVADGDEFQPCELRIFSGSSLAGRVYQTDGEGHKTLVAGPVGNLSALGTGAGDYATFTNIMAKEGLLSGASPSSGGRVSGAVVEGYTIRDITFSDANKLTDTTLGRGVTNNGTLTLSGTTTFTDAISQGAGASISLDTGAIVDIGALEYTKNVDFGTGVAERLHTYHLVDAGSLGAGITDATGEAHNLFTDSNVMINGALLTKYRNDVLKVNSYDAARGTITLELKGVETPHWDSAWGVDQKKSPWLGHLILDGKGKLANGNYMDFDSNAASLTEGTYRYNQLLSAGTTSQVDPNATSIVVSFRIEDAAGKTFASGYRNIGVNQDIAPAGEIWVYDTGSAFRTKVAGYVNGDTIRISNGDYVDLEGTSTRLTANNLVTHMVLADTSNDADHRVNTQHVVGGSVYVNSTGDSHTYISVMDARVTVNNLIGGNVLGDLNGDTHVYVHSGHVGLLTGGGYKGKVNNIDLVVDGGQVDNIKAGSWGNAWAQTRGDLHAQLLGGSIGTFTTEKNVDGDALVELSSKVTGLTRISASTNGLANGKHATLKLINENGVDEHGNQRVFSLMNTQVEGFDVIDIGTDGLVEFNVLGKFMTQSTGNRQVTLEGTGKVILSNSNDSNGNNGTGKYWLTVTKGVTLQLNNSFIHSQSDPSGYPTFEIQDGATFDFSGVPVKDGGGIGARLVISGHGVDGLGAMYKAGDVGLKSNLTALPFITVKGNASIGGTETFCSDHTSYQLPGFVDMYDGGANHTLTKQGSNTWLLQRITVKGGTLNITDTGSVQLTQNSSASPLTNGGLPRQESSSTDIVIDRQASMYVDEGAYKANNGTTDQINTFSARSLSGNGSLVLNNSHMYLYTEAENTDFYEEFRTATKPGDPDGKWYWNSEGYTYAVFGGTIADRDSTGGNMLIKAGSGRQFLSGSASTYDGITRMDDGILYLLGTSYGSMVKGSTTVSEGVLGTSHLEWNGGTVTLGNDVRIFNNGQALSGAVASGGVSEMLIRVNGLTSTADKNSVTVGAETYAFEGKTYHKVDISNGVETVLCHGVYGDGTRYYSGDKVDTSKQLYVLKDAGTAVPVNSTYLMVLEDTFTAPDGTVYHRVDTTGIKSLSVDGVYTDGTTYTAGATLTEEQQKKDLYVLKAENSMVYVTLDKPRFDDATYSGVLTDAQPVNGVANKGRLVKVGLGTLTLDQYNSYTGGTDVRAGTLNVRGWGLLGGTNSEAVEQTAGASLMLSYDGSYGADECFFINNNMNLVGRGDVRWSEQTGYTAALISNVGADFNTNTNFTLAGTLKGAGNLLHMGAGTLYIDGWNTEDRDGVTVYVHNSDAAGNEYTGGTTVTNGRVFVRKDAGLGATADGLESNLITLKGTEIHFEDCSVTLAAVQTMAREGYTGNSIEGKIVVGTETGTIRATGAAPDGNTMQQITEDVKVDPATLVIRGTGYWAESTKIDQDGSLVFQGGAATNCLGTVKNEHTDMDERQRAGYLDGNGNLVLDNDGKNGALAVTFADIGTGTDGFTGNIYVQGKNAALIIDDGDFDATKSAKQDSGNITISGDNVGIVARDSGIVIASGSKLTLASTNDAWQEGKTTYEVNEGMDGAPERAGAAGLTAKYITVVGGGTLEVIRGTADTYGVDSINDTDLAKLKKAATLNVDEAAALGEGIARWGENENVRYTNVGGAGLAVTEQVFDEETQSMVTREVRAAYNRVYDSDDALNKVSVGVVDTGDYESGPLRLAANSNLRLINSSLNLSDSALNLQRTAGEKVNLYLEFGEMAYHDDGTTSQIVLFTDVNGLYISHENMLGTPAAAYANTGDDVYVFKAADYFKDCWQITEDTLMVYDTRAKVIYLDGVIPEPATGALAVLGLAALSARRRRRKN